MAKEYSRTERVADLIQRELSIIIQRESQDPRFSLITISGVNVARDLAQAKVYITSYQIEGEDKLKEILRALNKASGFFRSMLASRIQLRTTPQLFFVYDESIEYGSRLSTLIDEALKRDSNDES